jgi:pimeloyl-ACP methyl ester carboxylesterase
MPNELSVRGRYPGEVLANDVDVSGCDSDLGAARLTILIHGYQNSHEQALERYVAFEQNLADAGVRRNALGAVWHFHWPGNHEGKLTSVITYAARIPDARSSGQMLAALFLNARRPDQQICIVGHSMGCRVALEAIRERRRIGDEWRGAEVKVLVLLAAAVPQVFCSGNRYFPAPWRDSTEHVFYSLNDMALGLAFNVAQGQYGEPGHAVGKDGRPIGRWTSRCETDFDHGDYWTSPFIAERVGEELGALAPIAHLPLRPERRRSMMRRFVSIRPVSRRSSPRRREP